MTCVVFLQLNNGSGQKQVHFQLDVGCEALEAIASLAISPFETSFDPLTVAFSSLSSLIGSLLFCEKPAEVAYVCILHSHLYCAVEMLLTKLMP